MGGEGMALGMRAVRVWRAVTRGGCGARVPSRAMASHSSDAAVVERYANSFTSVVKKSVPEKQLDAVISELKVVAEILDDAKLASALANPTLAREIKVDVCKAIAKKANLSKSLTNLMMLVAENGRGASMAPIVRKSVSLLSGTGAEGIEAIVTTAIVLTPHQRVMLQNKLQSQLQAPCSIKSVIDPSLLGGMTLQIGDQMMDMSVKREIQRLCALLQTSI
ncbi:ATP synthase subunit O, mitochondrial [Porphyridium purpureum]|uniref:ATP synthase subunit O, mitochondrial n=1 Tax=Porphyridium purpureum TaxID=35688 RepID=A0A5J4YIA3_PORPP|nr:ATP synthase subunit O, mitochondrial [Porphyridium purpureum]|eukprot:POR8044..scf251_18